ncbi:MAG: PKD domain-containing protein [Candidatus Micrarchaeia archaeon]
MEWKQISMVFVAMLVLMPAAFATYTCNSSSIVGDVNGDGQITSADASAASYLFMHSNEIPPNTCCMDVAPSVGINNGDAVKINLYVNNGGPNANTGDIGKHCYEINNLPPVITGTGGPASLNVNQVGTWTISANDPDGTYLSYTINWGENNGAAPSSPTSAATSTATFQHAYSQAGTYTVIFSVTDSAGASTQSTITVNVASAAPPQVLGKISYWWGKVNMHNSNGAWVSDPDGSSGANIEMVQYCKKFFPGTTEIRDSDPETINGWKDAGNVGSYSSLALTYQCVASSEQGSATSTIDASPNEASQGGQISVTGTVSNPTSSTRTYLVGIVYYATVGGLPYQAGNTPVIQEITLAPGETRSVYGNFVATTPNGQQNYNLAKISVYMRSGNALVSQSFDRVNVGGVTPTDLPPAIATFTGPSTLSAGTRGWWSAKVNDLDDANAHYIIQWGDGTSTPSASLVTGLMYDNGFDHIYSNAGTYTATLAVTDAHGTATAAQASTTTIVAQAQAALTFTAWAEPDVPNTSYGFYVKPLDGNQVPPASSIKVTSTVLTPSTPYYPNGNSVTLVMGLVGMASQYANQGVYGWGFGNTMPCGTYYYNTTVERVPNTGSAAQKSGTFVLSSPYCLQQATNQPPVITSVGGPTSLNANQQGTWSVSAYDPDGTYLTYNVVWGDEALKGMQASTTFSSTATFQHTYTQAGTYTITFTVKDAQGAQTQSTITVSVGGSSSSCSGFTTLHVGESVASAGYSARLSGISAATGAAGTHPAILDMIDSQNAVVGQIQVEPGTPYTHVMPSGARFRVSVCETSLGSTFSAKYAKVAVEATIEYNGSANQPPTITSVSDTFGSLSVGNTAYWTVIATDPGTPSITFSANFGDGTAPATYGPYGSGSGVNFQHAYAQAGTYTITFTVTDNLGASAQATKTVTVTGVGASCEGFTTLHVGEDVTSSGYHARLMDIIDLTSVRPAVINMLDSQYTVIGQIQVDPGSSYTFAAPNGDRLKVSVCETMAGPSLSSKNAKVKMSAGGSTIPANQPPVITGVGGPTSINVNQAGTWKVSARDPDGTYLAYSVNWGESGITPVSGNDRGMIGNTASFEHTYANAGAYTIAFTVTDAQGASTQSTLSVRVAGIAPPASGDVSASVGAIPTELYQYDSVYVTGKVSRGTGGASDDIRNYVVVLSLDNGNQVRTGRAEAVLTADGKEDVKTAEKAEVANAAYQAGSIASVQGASRSASGSIAPSQGKEEQITLAPGEGREVSAYFTASQLGTNFAKIMVYQKTGENCIGAASGAAEDRNCNGAYVLVASDTVKVFVKQGGIPSPPSEKMTLKFERGWNQVSVPTGYEVQLSDIQKKCDITSAWSYNPNSGQYEAATAFGKGTVGVWMKAGSACTYELEAPYASTWSSPLKAGWNMVGAPASGVSFASVAGSCKVTSGPWNYAPSAGQYAYSAKLEPGKGYWVKVASDCTLQNNDDSPPPVPSEATPAAQATTTPASVNGVQRTG